MTETKYLGIEDLISRCEPLVPADRLPDASYEWAKERAKEIFPKKDMSKPAKAKRLYDRIGLNYGFLESMNNGKFAPWPHEVEKDAECVIFMGCMYLIAKEMGLDPKMYNIFGTRSGWNESDMSKHHYEHAFIDVGVGRKNRFVIDKQLSFYGYVRHEPAKRLMKVNDNDFTKSTVRHYDNLIHLTEAEYVKKMNFLRSPEGQIKMLEEGQATGSTNVGKTLHGYFNLIYRPDNRILEEHVTIDVPLQSNKLFRYYLKVDDEGNLIDDTVDMDVFTERGWFAYDDVTSFGTFTYDKIKPILEYFRQIFITKDRNSSRHSGIDDDVLRKYLNDVGLKNDFTITDKDSLSKMIDVDGLDDAIVELEKEMKDNFDRMLKADKHMERGLGWNWMYEHARAKAIAEGKDYDGYLFPKDQRDMYVKDAKQRMDDAWQEEIDATFDIHDGEIGITPMDYRKQKRCRNRMRARKSIRNKHIPTFRLYRFSRESYNRIADVHVYIHKASIACGIRKPKKRRDNLPIINKEYLKQFKLDDNKDLAKDLEELLKKHGITELYPEDDGWDEIEDHVWISKKEPDSMDMFPIYKQVIFKNIINMYQIRHNLCHTEQRGLLQDKFRQKWAYRFIESQIPELEDELAEQMRRLLAVSGEIYYQVLGNPLYDVAKELQKKGAEMNKNMRFKDFIKD